MGKVKNIFKVVIVVLSAVLMVGVVSVLFKPKETAPTECTHENVKVLEGYAQTCEKNGLTEGKQCEDCEAILVSQEVIPASGHSNLYESQEAVEPTCAKVGWSAEISCGVEGCGKVIKEAELIPKETEHQQPFLDVPERAAACDSEGRTAGKACLLCTEANAGEFVFVEGGELIEKLPHTYGAWEQITPATCTEASNDIRVCSCGASDKSNQTPALGHSLKQIEKKQATCTEDGHSAYDYCEREGCTFTESYDVVPALGHTFNESGICSRCSLSNYLTSLTNYGMSIRLSGSGTSPMLVGQAEVTPGLKSVLTDNQTLGMLFIEYEDFNKISINPNWIKNLESYLESLGKTLIFQPAVMYNDGLMTAKLNVPYDKINTYYVSVPVVATYGTNGVTYMYGTDVNDVDESYRMSAASAAATCLNLYAQNITDADILGDITFNESTVELLNNTIDMSVDLTRGLSAPVFDGSKYYLEEYVIKYTLQWNEEEKKDIYTPEILGTFPVGTEFDEQSNVTYGTLNASIPQAEIDAGTAKLIFTCEFGTGAVEEDATAMLEHLPVDFSASSTITLERDFTNTESYILKVTKLSGSATVKLYFCGEEYTIQTSNAG